MRARFLVILAIVAAAIILVPLEGGRIAADDPPTPTVEPGATPSPNLQFLPIVQRSLPTSWVTIVREDFEGDFPGQWVVRDYYSGGGEFYWAKRNCRPYEGSFSGWAVGGGAQGSALPCGANYPDYAFSWMIYGPFSLADATAAELTLKMWVNTERDYDTLFIGASIPTQDDPEGGNQFFGEAFSGNSQGWQDGFLNLTNVYQLGNVTGHPRVWVALAFDSDLDTNTAEGVYVDNIVLRKYTGASGAEAYDAGSASTFSSSATLLATPAERLLRR